MTSYKLLATLPIGILGFTATCESYASKIPAVPIPQNSPDSKNISKTSMISQDRFEVFSEPLVANSDYSVEEYGILKNAIQQYKDKQDPLAIQPLTQYLQENPNSPWKVSLLSNMGFMYEAQGYISHALTYYAQATTNFTPSKNTQLSNQVDAVIGHQLNLYSRLGNVEALKILLKTIDSRTLFGSAQSKKEQATVALHQIATQPKFALRCGIMALANVLQHQNIDKTQLDKLQQTPSFSYGMSLTDLSKLSEQYANQPMQMVMIESHQPIPFPSVMHLKLGHYIAILDKKADKFHIKDNVLGQDRWVSENVLREEGSGNFLAFQPKTSDNPPFQALNSQQGQKIIGTGLTSVPPPPPAPAPGGQCGAGGGSLGAGFGMPVCSINNPQTSLTLTDTPVGYQTPKGEKISFTLKYFQRNTGQPAQLTFANLSPMWSYNWLGYIQDDGKGQNAAIYSRDGGYWQYSGYDATAHSYAREPQSQAQLIKVSDTPIQYKRHLKDGSIEVYAQSDNNTYAPRRIFLSKVIDPSGNTTTLSYDVGANNAPRLVKITDSNGQVTQLSYGNSTNALLITQVTDPFGRTAKFKYDAQGRLIQVTDAIGMSTSFSYDAGTFINQMTTPYGTSKFAYGENGVQRWLTRTDPNGFSDRQEFRHEAPGVAFSEPDAPNYPGLLNQYLNYRNSYYWDKNTTQSMGNNIDYNKAQISHWLHALNDWNSTDTILESVKNPLEKRIWYTYDGQPNPIMPGKIAQPSQIIQRLDDGQVKVTKYQYNSLGKVTQAIDAMGRVTSFDYSADGMDVTQIRQSKDGKSEIIASYTYNNQHKPTSFTDAAGNKTSYQYNAAGQILKVTNANGEAQNYEYDAKGYLKRILDASGKPSASYTYDTVGRIASITDGQGYRLTYQYDGLNRLVKTGYPDGTSQTLTWDKLDVVAETNRLGQTTKYAYDANRNRIQETSPTGQITKFSYNPSGELLSLTDGNGNTTKWTRDLEGRVISKTYPSGKTIKYQYDSVGRLIQTTDALGQTKAISYSPDDQPIAIQYQNAIKPTAAVSFSYDSLYPRPTQMNDGTGITSFQYTQAGQLKTETNPANIALNYTYDKLGRVTTTSLVGSDKKNYSQSYQYDNLGRVKQTDNTLGSFTYSYLGNTNQITQEKLVNRNWQTNYIYGDNQQDRMLTEISHNMPSAREVLDNILKSSQGAPIPMYGTKTRYENAKGMILSKQETLILPIKQNYNYDGEQRLTGVDSLIFDRKTKDSYLLDHKASYGYDKANNLVSLKEKSTQGTFTHNTDNEIVTENREQSKSTYQYDANGNLLNDGKSAYTWDAENRLLSIKNLKTGQVSNFTYDGLSRRVKVSEQTNGSAITENYLWCGSTPCAKANSAGSITGLYFEQGEYNASNNMKLYYGKDHLGSITQVVNDKGQEVGSQRYTPYGTVAKRSGITPTFGYAGMYQHVPSGLNLTLYRAYNPQTGRWLSKDPIEEAGGRNLYGYVGGNPNMGVDPYGLSKQLSIGLSATLAIFVGTNFGTNFTLSIPDDWMKWKCYQVSLAGNTASMIGVGGYAGYGMNFGFANTKGSLQSGFSHGIYRYGEADIGWNMSIGASFQGKENLEGHMINDLLDYEGWQRDLGNYPSSMALPIPMPAKYGRGFGLYSGMGATLVGSYTTPTFGECGECSQ